MKKSILLILFCLLGTLQVHAQSVGINSSGSSPDQSAMLDIASSSKGVLVPRMNSSQRSGISNAATGLLVFDTQEGTFFYYNGIAWENLSSPAILSDKDKDTKIQVEESTDEDIIRFDMQGTELLRLRPNQHGVLMVEPRVSNNTFLGLNAGLNNEPLGNGDGLHNTFIGYEAGQDNTEGSKNTLLGSFSGYELNAGHRNVYLGYETGKFNVNGNGNVWIGNQVGSSGEGSNQLRIDNQNNSNPLIYGEFNNNLLRVNGEFQVSAQGVERLKVSERNDITSLQLFDQGENTIVGDSAGASLILTNVLDGTRNTYLGYQAGQQSTTSYGNTMIGWQAGQQGGGNSFSTAVGWRSGWKTTGNYNAYFGRLSGHSNINGSNNTFIGDGAGGTSSGSNNVFLGNRAGEDEGGNNKLYITNSDDSTPLIYGDFGLDEVKINGDFEVGDQFRFNTNTSTAKFHVKLPTTDIVGARFQIGSSTKMSIHNNGGVSIGEYLTANTKVPSNGLYINGNVNLGTSTLHNDYRLQVDGKVACEEVNVELSQNWPDYVFQKDYDLATLKSVETFINNNGHLPGVPSAAEVEKDGVFLGEMQTIMMEKIEELTLHIIRLEKENNEIKRLINSK